MEEARFSPRPFLLPRTESPAVLSRPGMGNGVKEGVVRLREDAEPILPAHVSSKASTLAPPLGILTQSLFCTHTPLQITPEHAEGEARE